MKKAMTDSPPNQLVVGLGNRYRRDDGVGLVVARLVSAESPDGVTVIEGVGDAYYLIDKWSESSSVYLVDCALSDLEPGFIHKFDALDEMIPAEMFGSFSTHSFSLADAVRMARALDRLPRRLTLFGIEGSDLSAGPGLTPAVESAARRVAGLILAELTDQTALRYVKSD
jgi:hydrogenase maturation protease